MQLVTAAVAVKSAGSDPSILWYANRGTGVVLVALLTLATALGVVATARASTPAWPRFATQALHRNVSLISSALLLAHIATAKLDTYVDLTWLDALWPAQGTYAAKHFLPLALGSVAFDLLIVVVVTSLLRHRLNHRAWRVVHLFSYLAWALGALHGFLIGTDARTPWALGVSIISLGVVAVAVVVRVATWSNERRRDAHAAGTGTAALDLL